MGINNRGNTIHKAVVYAILAAILIAGFAFRLRGISTNHSFWSDEALVTSFSKDMAEGDILRPLTILNYQPLQVTVSAAALKAFGYTEYAARLPSVVLGTAGILFAFLLAAELSTVWGGLLAAILYAFSQLNLANATQAKPYTAIQTCWLIVLYLLVRMERTRKETFIQHALIVLFATASTLFHFIGVFIWIPYGVHIIATRWNKVKQYTKKPAYLIGLVVALIVLAWMINLGRMIQVLFMPIDGKILIIANHTTYARDLLWRNYAFIVLPALFGITVAFRKYKPVIAGMAGTVLTVLFLWNFRHYTHNVRYLVPLFGIFFVFFASFWAEVGEQLLTRKSWFTAMAVAVLLIAGGYKMARKPAAYYTPNADQFGDVQIADYKRAYALIPEQIPDYQNGAIFNDLLDTQRWYLPARPDANAYFVKGVQKGTVHAVNGKPVYADLKGFLKEKAKYPKGLLIVEDWESFLPDDIKEYAKKNLKREFRVEGLPEAEGDNWPIEVYSWGMEQQ